MLAGLRLADPQLRVLAAPPMDRQDDLARRLIDIGDDVGDQGAQQPLARAHGHARRVPGGIEIVGQPGEVGRRDGADQATAPPPAAPRRPRHGAAPPPSSSPAARRSDDYRDRRRRSAVPRARPRTAPAAAPVPRCAAVRPDVSMCIRSASTRRLDRHRLHGAQKLAGDRGVDAEAAEGQASRQPEHQVRADRIDRRAAPAVGPCSPPSGAGRSGRRTAARPAARGRRGPTSPRPPCRRR